MDAGADGGWRGSMETRLLGKAPRSWDSRYFGPIPLANVQGEIKPVIVW